MLDVDEVTRRILRLPPDQQSKAVQMAQLGSVISARLRFKRYQDDPVGYARDVLGVAWWSRQIEIAQSLMLNRRTVVYAGHSTGKSHLMGGLVQWHFDAFDPSITLTTAPNWSSIHDLLWGELKNQRSPLAPGRLLDLRLESGPMHYVAGHNAETGSGFQGRHEARVMLVLDEAMGIPPYIWEACNAMMTSPDCRIVALGNPTETSGDYYDIRENPDWSVIHISCLDHPNIAAELAGEPAPYPKAVSLMWVREMLKSHAMRVQERNADVFEFSPGSGEWYKPDDVFRSRVLGFFPRQSSNAIWSDEWLVAARERRIELQPDFRPAIGVDVARFGNDMTTLYGRVGPCVTHREIYSRQDLMATVGRVADMAGRLGKLCGIDAKRVAIHVDDTGVGGGATDRLQEMDYTVFGVDFGGKAIDSDAYHNRGSEMWFNVARQAQAGKLDLSRLEPDAYHRLSAELRARQYKIQSDRTLRVEGKEDLRKRLGRSPDDADGLVLCCIRPQSDWTMMSFDGEDKRTTAQAAGGTGRGGGGKPGKPHAFVEQIRNAMPDIYKPPAYAEEDGREDIQTCADCVSFDPAGKCTLRYFRVDAPTPACDMFDFNEMLDDE